jgi:hypothetical protein
MPAQSVSGPSPLGLATYFTVSDLRLPFSSPLTTRRVTVEVFDPASTRVSNSELNYAESYILLAWTTHRKHSTVLLSGADHIENTASYIVACWNVYQTVA